MGENRGGLLDVVFPEVDCEFCSLGCMFCVF